MLKCRWSNARRATSHNLNAKLTQHLPLNTVMTIVRVAAKEGEEWTGLDDLTKGQRTETLADNGSAAAALEDNPRRETAVAVDGLRRQLEDRDRVIREKDREIMELRRRLPRPLADGGGGGAVAEWKE